MGIDIMEIGGNCPVEAEGTFDGYWFYFRARGRYWSVDVWTGPDGPWNYGEQYGDIQFAASWMSEDEARKMIGKAYKQFTQRKQ